MPATVLSAAVPPSRRERRRAARTEEVLDAAMAIVVEEGYERLTIAKIAKRLDAAVGALYRYFPGKEGVIRGLQARAMKDLKAYIVEHVAAAREEMQELPQDIRALALIGVAAIRFVHHGVDRAEMHELVDRFMAPLTNVYNVEEARDVEDKFVIPTLELYTELLSSAAAIGAIDQDDALLRTFQLWASFHGLDHFRKRDRMMPDHVKTWPVMTSMLNTLWRGWGASSETSAAALKAVTDRLPAVSYS